jgi:type IV secretion system protein VirB10
MSDSDSERGISAAATTARPIVSAKVAAGVILLLMGGVVGFALWRNANPPDEPVKEKLPASLGAMIGYTAPVMIVPKPAAASPPGATPVVYAQPHFEAPPLPVQQQPPPPAGPRLGLGAVTKAERPKPYMLTYAAPPSAAKPSGPPGAPGEADDGSKVAYTASVVDGVKAGLLGDLTFKLMPGLMPCIMDTAINSTFEGPIQCHVPFDIRPHGVTLLGRNSIVHGWYHNQIQTGQSRVFVQADWVHDPATGCFIKFRNAPVADSIGEAGVDGSVDPHNWQRFGAAMLLTLGQMGESLGQAALSKGGNTYLSFNGNGGGGVDQIATAILRKQIDIPPTITVNQGTAIGVFNTEVLDFSPCYDIKVKG